MEGGKALVDYHVHTPMCGHAVGELEDYVKAAQARGLHEIGFSDHLIFHMDNRDYSMPLKQFPLYIKAVEAVQRRFPRYQVKVGVEVDYFQGENDVIKSTFQGEPLDYVLGSVHCINGWVFDDERYISEYKRRDIDEFYEEYFKLVQEAALSGLFDVIAHPDVIKKFGYKPIRGIKSLYIETVQAFKEAGICVEVNTSGLRKPVHEIYPSVEFLKLCFEKGLPVTLGSDAHSPEEVGWCFDKAVDLLRNVGYREITVFTGRKRKAVMLE